MNEWVNEWVVCPQCWDACQGKVGAPCSSCGVPQVATPLFKREQQPVFNWLNRQEGNDVMKCPDCKTKLTTKNYDPEYEWYECPKCEGAFTHDEIEEASSGTSLAVRANGKDKPLAKGKKRRTEIAEDEEALAAHDAETLKPKASNEPQVTKHRDEVESKAVREIMADEIQEVGHELGVEIDRLNAVEWYGFNLWIALHTKGHISARDKKVPMVKCGEHA